MSLSVCCCQVTGWNLLDKARLPCDLSTALLQATRIACDAVAFFGTRLCQ
jgi:hypothetical protein